ncbi:Periplasmic serine endoprotease DegP precursor [Stieleria maiorica]|uniref:Periplasmic serine endoprotease DegP n=1 Tax=Stieleria maiorica TaxID=2795974 RepID=A0A5B9MLU2_9BACT|nr:trypsin-like peptidase domain-containing protein [Stieleria maiorica]QEG00981.1 Periplasmic serine endoprotease DegP precursor [Stieleria maiorica]
MLFSRILIALVFSGLTTMMVTACLADDAESKAAPSQPEPKPLDATPLEQADSQQTSAQQASGEQVADGQTAAEQDAETENAATGGDGKPAETDPEVVSSEVLAALQAGPRALSLAFRMAAKRATPSVVVLYAYGQDGGPGGPSDPDETETPEDELPLLERAEIPTPPPAEEKLTGLGSGVIVSEDGLIITNNHVITGATRVVVQLPDETRVDAEVVRGDPDSDVAMVRVNFSEKLDPIAIGDSDKLEIGDWVLAIGSPFKLEATVSAGIISGKNRRLDRIRRSSMLQTDAAINPGNSGGALIDLDGKVVGISTAIATRSGFYQGVGFAIPINQARWIADELDRHAKVRRAAIGTTLVELKPRIAKQFNLEPYSGILVYQIIKGSVAEQAGIQPQDVIVEFAGEQVRDSIGLQEAIERKPIGSKQPIVVRRQGKRVELTVELATVDDPTGQD